MIVDGQIRNERLQYDAYRKAAKILALISGKIDKHEYLTGEEILLPNQIIEQAKFTYSPLGKAFEKQIKRIEDQGKKWIDTLKTLKPKELEATEDKSNFKHDKKFYELSNERIGDIYNISKETNFNNLICYFNGSNIAPINIIAFKGPMRIRNKIINGDTTIEKTEKY